MLSLKHEMDLNHCTHQAEFAHTLMSSICGEHQLDTCGQDTLDFHYEGIRLPHKRMAIGKISYGANVLINTSNLGAYSISLPIQGKQTLSVNGGKYISDPNKGLILSNSELQDLAIAKDCKKYQVVIPEQSMKLVLESILRQPVNIPIVFNPEMNFKIDNALGMWWQNIFNLLLCSSQYKGGQGLQLWSEDFENFLIKMLLLSQENNYSTLLNTLCNRQEPEYLSRVRNYIKQYAHNEIRAEDLERLAGVSKSKLYTEFKKYYGISPLSFLRRYRLQQIYKILNTPTNPNISISNLAFDWGFKHLGRFSKEYCDEFGENPSETRNRAKSIK